MSLEMLAALLQAGTVPSPALVPAGKWNIEYADNMCVLSRSYGTKEQPLILGFKPAPMSDNLQIVVLRAGPKSQPRYGKARIAVDSAAPADHRYMSFSTKTSGARMTLLDIKRADLAALTTRGRLAITTDRDVNHAFEISSFDIAMRGLDACETDLLKSWGMSEAVLASIAVKPEPLRNLAAYINDGDYPDQAIRKGEQGASGIRFMVAADGSLSDCRIVEPSGSELLDEATCRIVMTRAKFRPASDQAGEPVPCLYFTRIRWVLPDG